LVLKIFWDTTAVSVDLLTTVPLVLPVSEAISMTLFGCAITSALVPFVEVSMLRILRQQLYIERNKKTTMVLTKPAISLFAISP